MSKSRILWGISALAHDASLCVVRNSTDQPDELLYASHAERYSRVKNDGKIHPRQVKEAYDLFGHPDHVYWYENSLLKRQRYLTSGMWKEALSLENSPKRHLRSLGISAPLTMGNHHLSHAAGAYYTRPPKWENESVDVLVADAIGEYDTLTCWTASKGTTLRRIDLKTERYPKSLGLLYTAITQHVGLKPNEEEFILMGMAAYGRRIPHIFEHLYNDLAVGRNFHKGLLASGFDPELLHNATNMDLARTAQEVVEFHLLKTASAMRNMTNSRYLCLSGGVALNCVANTKLALQLGYEDVWIMPNPGDAGSALGAILQHTRKVVPFRSVFLGTNIRFRSSNTEIVDWLAKHKIAGVARGRAEWGPRALGARSLFADPRNLGHKKLVNNVKQREEFRPFAPAVLSEMADDYFQLPKVSNLEYMQYTVKCKRPDMIPACIHADGTSRVQVVGPNHQLRGLLERWYARTGCPVLLNTSLNIKGEPLVNNRNDAANFERVTNIKVFT